MSKINIFISSKVNPKFEGLDKEYSLGDLRKVIKREIEAELFLGEKVFNVLMNEESFVANFSKDAYTECLDKIKKSDVVFILYNGDAGWAPENTSEYNGICHAEYLEAFNNHPSMSFGVNLSEHFKNVKYNKAEEARNKKFKTDYLSSYRFSEYSEAKTVASLESNIIRMIKDALKKSLSKAFSAKKQLEISNNTFGKTLDWSKLNYSQRVDNLTKVAIKTMTDLEINKEIILKAHSIPDNMSVSDARNIIKRPFLYEQDEITKSSLKKGIIHFITIYGSATESQVKSLVGHPDLTVIKTDFGFYLWEQNTHIQIFFLSNCKNPDITKNKIQQVDIWLKASNEIKHIDKRAKARYSILKAINNSKTIIS